MSVRLESHTWAAPPPPSTHTCLKCDCKEWLNHSSPYMQITGWLPKEDEQVATSQEMGIFLLCSFFFSFFLLVFRQRRWSCDRWRLPEFAFSDTSCRRLIWPPDRTAPAFCFHEECAAAQTLAMTYFLQPLRCRCHSSLISINHFYLVIRATFLRHFGHTE